MMMMKQWNRKYTMNYLTDLTLARQCDMKPCTKGLFMCVCVCGGGVMQNICGPPSDLKSIWILLFVMKITRQPNVS